MAETPSEHFAHLAQETGGTLELREGLEGWELDLGVAPPQLGMKALLALVPVVSGLAGAAVTTRWWMYGAAAGVGVFLVAAATLHITGRAVLRREGEQLELLHGGRTTWRVGLGRIVRIRVVERAQIGAAREDVVLATADGEYVLPNMGVDAALLERWLTVQAWQTPALLDAEAPEELRRMRRDARP